MSLYRALLVVGLGLGLGVGFVVFSQVGEVQAGGAPCAVDVEVQTTATFIGVTSSARALDAGYPLFNADCNNTYPDSRMCTEEMLLATIPAPVPGVDALIQSSVVAADGSYLYLAGGIRTLDGFRVNCSGSLGQLFVDDSSAGRAEIITAAGNLDIEFCNSGTSYVIACCAIQ